MKQKLALAVLLIGGLVAGLPALAQSGNALSNLSSLYGGWVAYSSSVVAAGAGTVVINNCYVNVGPIGGGRTFFPFATNVPVTIADGANTETVTPSAVQTPIANTEPAGNQSPYFCSFTATFSNAHTFGSTTFITSGDSGAAEAANDNGGGYPLTNGVIKLSGHCTGTTGSAITGALSGVDPGTAIACATAFAPSTAGGTSIPRVGMMKSLTVTASHVGTNTSSGVVTVYQNGSATTITCTIGTGSSCSDATHSVSVAAGDVISIAYTSQTSDVLAGVTATLNVF